MHRIIITSICFILSYSPIAISDTIPTPSGWEEAQTDNGRVITRGDMEMIVTPRITLKGQSVASYLNSIETEVPASATFQSSDGVVPEETTKGAYTATRAIIVNGVNVSSTILACPSDATDTPAYVRTITLNMSDSDASIGKIMDLLAGGKFVTAVCRNEQSDGTTESAGATVKPSLSNNTSEIYPKHTVANTSDSSSGWRQSIDSNNNAITYRPNDTSSNVSVNIYQAIRLDEAIRTEAWLFREMSNSKAPLGEWTNEPQITRQSANMANGTCEYINDSGEKRSIYAVAVTADRRHIRYAVGINLQNKKNDPYFTKAVELTLKVVKLEIADAKKQGREKDWEYNPPSVKGIQAGGIPVKAGLYRGTFDRKGSELQKRELTLYSNGEYKLGKKTGQIIYSHSTGAIELQGADWHNRNSLRPRITDVSIFGIDQATNKIMLYRREYTNVTRLYWISAPEDLPPSQQKELDAQLKAEAARYKYITQIGDGIDTDDIESVVYASSLSFSVGGSSLESNAWLLLKDGRVMDNVPVAPDLIDLAKSRSREPERWGWWRKKGNGYEFAWSTDKTSFSMPASEKNQLKGKPFPTGTRLNGTWRASKSFSSAYASSSSFWGVHFTDDGRFEKFSNSMMQSSGGGTLATRASNNGNTAVSVSGPSAAGGSSTQRDTTSDRTGNYEFDGYNLTLNFDNGKTRRHFTFAVGEDRRTIWFEGEGLHLK